MFKCVLIFEWQFSLNLASCALSADNSYVNQTSKTFSDLFLLLQIVVQIVEILPDNNTLSSKQL